MSLVQITASYDTLESLRATPLPGEEFPYATTGYCGMKCCSKCGATKTPQWREGPCGPKTLCNACGVKRTRTLRALQEGSKRRRASPAAPRAKPEPTAGSCGSLDVSSAGASTPPPLFVGGRGYATARRPQRRAAEEAAMRTARYARTGEWVEEEAAAPYGSAAVGGGQEHHPVSAALLGSSAYHQLAIASRGGGSPASSQDTALGPCADAELDEVAWTPLAAEAAARHGLGVAAMDSACYAAVNLMTLAAKEAAGKEGAAAAAAAAAAAPRPGTPTLSSAGAGGSSPPAGVASPLPRQRVAPATPGSFTSALPALPALAGVDLPALYKSLPPGQVVELIGLNADLERALAAAKSSGASVAALAQLLAEKQAASLAARQAARAASRRMHRFLAALGGEVARH